MTRRTPTGGGKGSNQYATKGVPSRTGSRTDTTAVAGAVQEPSAEEVAWTFDPNSDAAWDWAFPDGDADPDSLLRWELQDAGFTAVTARRQVKPFLAAGYELDAAIPWAAANFTVPETDRYCERWDDPAIPARLRDAGVSPDRVLHVILGNADPATLPDLPAGRRTRDSLEDSAALYANAGVYLGHTVALLARRDGVTLGDALCATINPGGPYPRSDDMNTSQWRTLMSNLRVAGYADDEIFQELLGVDVDGAVRLANPRHHGPNAIILEGTPDDDTIERAARWVHEWSLCRGSSVQRSRYSYSPDVERTEVVAALNRLGWRENGPAWWNVAYLRTIQHMYPDWPTDLAAAAIEQGNQTRTVALLEAGTDAGLTINWSDPFDPNRESPG